MKTDLRTRAREIVEQLRARCSGGAFCHPEEPCTPCEAVTLIEALLAELDAQADAERDRVVAWLRAENGLCDCHARSESECACGAWDDYKSVYLLPLADRIAANEHRPNVSQAALDAVSNVIATNGDPREGYTGGFRPLSEFIKEVRGHD